MASSLPSTRSILPCLLVHGGAGARAREGDRGDHLAAVRGALERGLSALGEGAAAACVAAVRYMESETSLNAGRGAVLDAGGRVRLDAGFMDGASRRFGGVAGVASCENPILLARHLADDGEFGRFLHGEAADRLAAELGVALDDASVLVTERARRGFEARRAGLATAAGDTVGAVALDARGRLAAAVSTGGTALKRDGRIGDSPVVGAGFWADQTAACVTTGIGEALLRDGSARRCAEAIACGASTGDAARSTTASLSAGCERAGGLGGLICLDVHGSFAFAHDTDEMTSGWARPDGSLCVRTDWE